MKDLFKNVKLLNGINVDNWKTEGVRHHNTDSAKKMEMELKGYTEMLNKMEEEEKNRRVLSKTYRYYPQIFTTNDEEKLNNFLKRSDIYKVKIDHMARSNDILYIVYYELREEIITEV